MQPPQSDVSGLPGCEAISARQAISTCDEMGELGVQVEAQLIDLMFQPFIRGDLLLLALLDSFQVGQDHIGKQASDGSKGSSMSRF